MSDQKYDNTNRGALFTNRRKETATQPDWQGNINVDGRDYWISGWNKTHPAQGQWFSLSVKPKDGAPPVRTSAPSPDPYARDLIGNKTEEKSVPF